MKKSAAGESTNETSTKTFEISNEEALFLYALRCLAICFVCSTLLGDLFSDIFVVVVELGATTMADLCATTVGDIRAAKLRDPTPPSLIETT